jgi:hypothetical protein
MGVLKLPKITKLSKAVVIYKRPGIPSVKKDQPNKINRPVSRKKILYGQGGNDCRFYCWIAKSSRRNRREGNRT